ncbi:hypothetical protein TRV_01627 [Trichophyton verrucosum HKI 0517]|uniref:Uncharacterized protein n=1 Tax=Trichophyton verrucosum (strain HKI 0517) TaxID=663202 RepID=D4D3G7_TRIVH|nr:uncharacterized protein TRV_01627 [Trichophyton verrucosum HKI 0517]EFE43583.1 hypothetical protein TRV_01627 [Trichophyton verrucosum HKI 0517]
MIAQQLLNSLFLPQSCISLNGPDKRRKAENPLAQKRGLAWWYRRREKELKANSLDFMWCGRLLESAMRQLKRDDEVERKKMSGGRLEVARSL